MRKPPRLFIITVIALALAFVDIAYAVRPKKYPTAEEIRELFATDEDLEEYSGSEGYGIVAEAFFDGFLRSTYIEVSRALGYVRFERLGWPTRFTGSATALKIEQERLNPQNIEKYRGVDGYVRYSDDFYNGQMDLAMQNVRAAATVKQFSDLEWPATYPGSTAQYHADRARLADTLNPASQNRSYLGRVGYLRYAKDFTTDHLTEAFKHGLSALSPAERELVDWGPLYLGTRIQYDEDEARLTPETLDAYRGRAGYVRYADDFYGGDMRRAKHNVYSVLYRRPDMLRELDWGTTYPGTTKNYHEERARLLADKNRFHGPEGYVDFANLFTDGRMALAHARMSNVLNEQEREELGWGKSYKGSSHNYESERSRLTHDFIGRAGYIRYAELFYDGNLARAFTNASAVLTDAERLSYGWGTKFEGNVTELYKIRKFLSGPDGKIDFVRWYGRQNAGLDQANEKYIEFLGKKVAMTEVTRMRVRYQIRAAFSDDEIELLGWSVSHARRPKPAAPETCQVVFH